MLVTDKYIKKELATYGQRALSTSATVHNSYLMADKCIRNKIPGDFVECGVFDGTQIAAMSLANQCWKSPRKVHLFDSFEGIPQAGPNDDESITSCIGKGTGRGELITTGVSVSSVKAVQAHMKGWGINPEQLVYHQGWFQDTVPKAKIMQISLLRLDGDLYESTKVCLEHLHPYVSRGGYIIIDDYALTGCRKACDEYWDSIRFVPDIQVIEGGGGLIFYKV